MCGICGLFHTKDNSVIERETIERMKARLEHRGPDDEGTHLDGGVGLGFRRLSIIDLAQGHQPMYNEDSTVVLVFNGEIYNHLELRDELVEKGHEYKTGSDTETIVHLYEEEGISCFSRLNGMFAVALWDSRKKQLVIARDRLGIKPIYYFWKDDTIGFASEIKALFESGLIEPDVSKEAIAEYLIFRYTAGEDSFFSGVRNLLPGHILICDDSGIRDESFWDLPQVTEPADIGLEEGMSRLEELLDQSVNLRLMSDVPLGTFCSGGVDSSLVTALASQYTGSNLNTFSVGFGESDYDESRYAKVVSERYKTNHHPLMVNVEDFADLLPKMIWYNDEPLNHPNSVQIYQISKLAREFVTVVLTGEGADELFGGYPRYLMLGVLGGFNCLPTQVRKVIGLLMSLVPHRKVRKLSGYMPLSIREAAALNSSFINWNTVSPLLIDDYDLSAILEKRLGLTDLTGFSSDRALDYLYRVELRTYLVSILNRQDKMSMAASIESRVPFLDHRLVEWALGLNSHLKHGKLGNKLIVKKLGEKWLPKEVIYRQKSGFGVPLSIWFREKNGLGRYLDLLTADDCRVGRFVNIDNLRKLIRDHLSGNADNSELIWTLMNLELWYRIFIEKSSF